MKKIASAILLTFALLTQTAISYALQASWYSAASLRKEGTWRKGEQRMANGQRFDENAYTCATNLWPLGSRLLITNLENGKTVEVMVTDRIGKRFADKRVDLAKGAFLRLSPLSKGIIPIKAEKVPEKGIRTQNRATVVKVAKSNQSKTGRR